MAATSLRTPASPSPPTGRLDLQRRLVTRQAVLAVLDVEADRGAGFAVDLDVREVRDADQLQGAVFEVALRDRHGLHGLVEGTGPDHLDMRGAVVADRSGHRSGHRSGVGAGRNPE